MSDPTIYDAVVIGLILLGVLLPAIALFPWGR